MNFLVIFFVLLGSIVKTQDSVDDGTDVNDVETIEQSYFSKSHPIRDSKDLLALDLKASEDVKVSYKIIPLHNESLLFYLGDKVEILLGFENTGTTDLYITDVNGAFVSPHDNTVFAFNNTAFHFNITAKQNEHHSFYYPFLINPHSNPIDYGVVAFVYYVNGRGDEFKSVIVNETLIIKDAPSAIKAGKFFLIILVIAVVVTLGIVFRKQIIDFFIDLYSRFVTKGSGKRVTSKRSRTEGSTGDDDSDEWLKHTSTHAFQKNQQREKEKKEKKEKRDISQSPNPGLAGTRTKRGRSPPSDATDISNTGNTSFVLKEQK